MKSSSHSSRGKGNVSWHALAGIIVLIAVPGILSVDDSPGDQAASGRTTTSSEDHGRLRFQKSGAINAFISDDGLMARKKLESELYAVAITNRHLKLGESFEIKLEGLTKFVGNDSFQMMAFGITNHTYAELATKTADIARIQWLNFWRFTSDNDESKPEVQNFYKNGQRMGVMIKEDGSFNIYDDGVDQGKSYANLPGPVYGAVEFMSMGLKATIMDQA